MEKSTKMVKVRYVGREDSTVSRLWMTRIIQRVLADAMERDARDVGDFLRSAGEEGDGDGEQVILPESGAVHSRVL